VIAKNDTVVKEEETMERIASITTRKQLYWIEVRSALPVLGFVLILTVLLCLGAVKFLAAPWTNAALTCALIIGPPIWFFWPDYPTEDDVERDRALRRSAGMPDDVEPD